jgi:TonB dependent receptor/Carboxypeptidase regulatory-like domain
MEAKVRSRVHSIILRGVATAGLLVCVTAQALAQSEATVRGQAVAAADGSALPAASITLKSVSSGEVREVPLDGAGRFLVQQVVPGEYVLSGKAEGFAPRELQFALEPREIKVVTLPLEVGRLEVNVEVTAEGSSVSTHSPSSTVLTAQQFETLTASQQTNLTDAIVTAAPGMIRGHDDFVHIRGHEVALNPVINGVSFWENPHFLLSPGLSPLVIDTANVMTGGFSAEYGNRFGGVVDIVTKSGMRMQHDGFVAATGGQAGRGSATGEVGGHRSRFGYYVFGSVSTSDRFLSPPDPVAIHDSGRTGHGFVQLDANLGGSGALRIVLMGDGANFEIPKTPLDVAQRPLANASERSRQQTSIVGWTRASSNLALAASFYQRWSSSRLSPADGPLTAVAKFDRDLLTIGGKADVTRFAGRQAIKAGIDAVRLRPDEVLSYNYSGYSSLTHLRGWPHIHFTGGTVDVADRQSGGQVSAYVQDAIQLGDRVTADLGVRLDRYSLVTTATHASPRVNLAFRVGANTVVHASYNHFFAPPPIEGILTSSAGLTQRIREIGVALPALEPTTEHQVELGGSTSAGPLRLALTGYYRSSDNPVHTTVWPDSRIYSYASFDRERAHGLEARVEAPSLARYGVTGYLNYALGRVNFYNPVTGGFVTEAAHITETSRFLAPMDQTHTMSSGLTYRHARSGAWAGTILEYGSGTPMGHGGGDHEHAAGEADHEDATSSGGAARVPEHFTANLSFGIDLLRRGNARGKLSFQLDIENLTDNVYLIAQEGEFSPSQYAIPRLVLATARFRF